MVNSAQHPSALVWNAGEKVADRMDEIRSYFKPDMRIAVVLFSEEYPDRDFVLMNCTFDQVRAVIDRRRDDPKTIHGEV